MNPDNPASDKLSEESSSSGSGALDEFSLINKFFVQNKAGCAGWPSQGIGDDCAILNIGSVKVAVTADMMALGTHFLDDADPYTVGRKALAVNLSDLAAAGSTPRAFFLSIALPKPDAAWLEAFSRGLFEEAERYQCPLEGGDTTKSAPVEGKPGKICISICAMGEVKGVPLTRKGAKPGDDVWVSGTPGDAFAALGSIWKQFEVAQQDFSYFKSRLDTPTPRVQLGEKLSGVASACCDVSDGLIGDLNHILERSEVSAVLEWADFPRSEPMSHLPEQVQRRCILSGGDDYELLFTAPEKNREAIEELGRELGVPVTRIGKIVVGNGTPRVLDKDSKEINALSSFNHFA